MNDATVLPTLPLSCHFLTNAANIWWRGCNWYKWHECIWRWAHCFLEFNSGKTFARNGKRRTLQTPCKCLANVANASECLTNVTNGLRMLTNIDGEWQHSQHSLIFRRRFLNWLIFVGRWRMTCERSEYVTNAYKYSESVANFERMSNHFIRKHIRKHIRLCVRIFASFARKWQCNRNAGETFASMINTFVTLASPLVSIRNS